MSRVRKHSLFVFLAPVILIFSGIWPPAAAQVSTGSVSGSIVDPQGGRVPNASVSLINKNTNQAATTQSDSTGLFRLNLLQPGAYRMEITKPGFRKTVYDSVDVAVGADHGLGLIKLTIGEVATVIEVTTAFPLIETSEAQVTNAFSAKDIETFPGVSENEGVDFIALTVPGVGDTRDVSFSQTNGSGISVNGLRGRSNDQQIDGQDNNDNAVAGPNLRVSDPEFIQEYQITTSNFSPEYGRDSGSVVNVITKSGTNRFHGSIYGTESNSALDALSNTQKRFEGLKKPKRFNSEFTGGTLGGPLWKDHLFFFGGFDDQIIAQQQLYTSGGESNSNLTPTPAGIETMLACYGNTNSMQALQAHGPYGVRGGNPTPVPGTSMIFPVTNCTDNVARNIELAQVERTLPTGFTGYNFPIKLDLQTEKNHFFGRYLYQRGTYFNFDEFLTAAAGYPINIPGLIQDYGFSWVRTLSNRMSNEFRASYGRSNLEFGGNTLGNTVPDQQHLAETLTRIRFNNPSLLAFGPPANTPQGRVVNTYQLQDNWNYFAGRQSLKAGVNFTYEKSPNVFLPFYNGRYFFSDWSSYGANVPSVINIAQGNPLLDFREKDTFVYFGDDLKAGKNLTLNLGITWSYYGQPANLFHRFTVQNQNGSNPLWNPAVPASATILPSLPSRKNSWGPSVGFAWAPTGGGILTGHGKTVLRGGYRISYDPPFYDTYTGISTSAPSVFLQTLSGASIGSHNLPASPTGANVRADLASALVRGVFDPRTFNDTKIPSDFGPQRIHGWSLGVQREIAPHAVVEARYVGNHGTHLFQAVNGNPRIDGLMARFPNLVPKGLTPCTTATTLLGPGQTVHPELGRVDCNQGIVKEIGNTGYSDYNGLQLEFRSDQLWNQLGLKTNYTFSKTTDNTSEIFSTFASGNTSSFAQSQVNFSGQEHGLSGLDFPHRWTLSFTESVPAFRAQHGLLGHILGGWGISGTYIMASGQTYTPIQGFLNCFSIPQPIGCFTPPAFTNPPGQDMNATSFYDLPFTQAFVQTTDQALRPFVGNLSAPAGTVAVFAADACNSFGIGCQLSANQLISLNAINNGDVVGTPVTAKDARFIVNGFEANTLFGTPFGTARRNSLRNAHSNIGNFSLFKTFNVRESFKVQWHMTMLNAFNHPNYSSVDPFIEDAGFAQEGFGFANPKLTSGGIQTTTGQPGRSIRFGMKLFW